MEDIKILEWIKDNSDFNDRYGENYSYGDGSGCGGGYDPGYSDGSGYGPSDGFGDGSIYSYDIGYGCGNSSGFGYSHDYGDGDCSSYRYIYGIKSFNSKIVYLIDGVQTIISDIKQNLAKGFILNIDFSLSPCYICKGNGYFAHGETLKEAKESLRKKILDNMNTNEVIEQFLSTFEKEKKYPAKDFYEWHHYLTGSCKMGRKSFMQDRNITFDDMYTVDEFIALCENSYGGKIIKELKERWNGRNG